MIYERANSSDSEYIRINEIQKDRHREELEKVYDQCSKIFKPKKTVWKKIKKWFGFK